MKLDLPLLEYQTEAWPRPGGFRARRGPDWSIRRRPNGGLPPVAFARDRPDEALAGRAEGFSELRNLKVQRGIGHG